MSHGPQGPQGPRVDLILSSGFLGFARHLGFLRGVDELGLRAEAIMGTSSGAVVGGLYAAGHSPSAIAEMLHEFRRPIARLGFSRNPLRGFFSLEKLIEFLEAQLPARFEELERPFAVGVSDSKSQHRLITGGPLAPAIAASSAIPRIFQPILLDVLDGERCVDGGVCDRVGALAYDRWRVGNEALIHRILPSLGRELPGSLDGRRVVESPRSRASLFSLGDARAEAEESYRLTLEQLRSLAFQ